MPVFRIEVTEAVMQSKVVTVEAESPLEAFRKIEAGDYRLRDVDATMCHVGQPTIHDTRVLSEFVSAKEEEECRQ